MKQEPEYYSINDVAEILNISHNTIRHWIKKGKCPIPFVKVCGNLRIRKTGLEGYLKKIEVHQHFSILPK